jgi:flagellar basal-body rod protein FlgF
MENPSYIAMAHMGGLRRQLDILANNIANVSTPGFQAERLAFQTLVSDRARSPMLDGAGQKISFAADKGVWRDTRAGAIDRTGEAFDIALMGPGYFAVQSEDGERFTRSGSFRPDAQGRLTLANGALLLQDNGTPITLPPGETAFEIDRRGTISGKDGPVGRIRVVTFEDDQALRKIGDSLYETDAEPRAADARSVVAQGMIERSNVQPVVEISQLIDLTRRYQSTARMVEQEHERARRAIEKLGRLA